MQATVKDPEWGGEPIEPIETNLSPKRWGRERLLELKKNQ